MPVQSWSLISACRCSAEIAYVHSVGLIFRENALYEDDGPSTACDEQKRLIVFAAGVAADVAAVRRVADALHDAWAEGGLARDTTEVAEVAAAGCRVIGLALATVERTLDCACAGRLPPS